MHHKLLDLKRVLRGLLIFLLVCVALLYIALPIGMGVYAVLPGREAVGGPPEGFEEVPLEAEDGVKLETAFNQMFAVALGSRASLWIASETDHTGALSRYPEEYEQRVIEFFDESFLL